MKLPALPSRARRWLAPLALLLALAAVPAAAQAPAPASTVPTRAKLTRATLRQCVVAVDQAGRIAVFEGQMLAVARTQRMEIRIDVEEATPSDRSFHVVEVGAWKHSDPGVQVYGYIDQVRNLDAPAAYRAVVRYRWLDARMHVLRRAQRRTQACVQPDERPKLVVAAVSITAARRSSNAQYQIAVRNGGRGPAGPFGVLLTVNGTAQPELTVPALAPASRMVLVAVAPRCLPASTVIVALDPQGQVHEATGGGLPRMVACPLPAVPPANAPSGG
jgi:CARDB